VTGDWRDSRERLEHTAQIDATLPNAARVADYLDGGRDNFEADRKAARGLVGLAPVVALIAPAWRAFLVRVVEYLVREAGVRQFLFVGTTPAGRNDVHQIVWSADPAGRIVIADDDQLVLAHARALMREGAAGFVDAGIDDPGAIVAGARQTLDFAEPVAIMLLFVLAFIDDTAAAAETVAALAAAGPPGSHVAIHHIASDMDPAVALAAGRWNQQSPRTITLRSRAQVESLAAGLDVVPPGLVPITDWRPSPDDPRPDFTIPLYGMVARKP
jgi:S-adenosyl methyltransferase